MHMYMYRYMAGSHLEVLGTWYLVEAIGGNNDLRGAEDRDTGQNVVHGAL